MVQRFLEDAVRENVAPQISRQLVDILEDPSKVFSLKLELEAIIDVGESFVKATYALEGDGPLVFSCFERLQGVSNACQNVHLPNVHAVAVSIVKEDPKKCSSIGAVGQKKCRACNSVVFAKIQRGFTQQVECLQGCKNNVPCNRSVAPTNTSKRAGFASVSVPGQSRRNRFPRYGTARLYCCLPGRQSGL